MNEPVGAGNQMQTLAIRKLFKPYRDRRLQPDFGDRPGKDLDRLRINPPQARADDDALDIDQFGRNDLGLLLKELPHVLGQVPGHQIASGNGSCWEVVPLPTTQYSFSTSLPLRTAFHALIVIAIR